MILSRAVLHSLNMHECFKLVRSYVAKNAIIIVDERGSFVGIVAPKWDLLPRGLLVSLHIPKYMKIR